MEIGRVEIREQSAASFSPAMKQHYPTAGRMGQFVSGVWEYLLVQLKRALVLELLDDARSDLC